MLDLEASGKIITEKAHSGCTALNHLYNLHDLQIRWRATKRTIRKGSTPMTLTVDQLNKVSSQLKAHGITKEFKITQSKNSLTAILRFVNKGVLHTFKFSYDGQKFEKEI